MAHKLSQKHVKALASEVASVVMPRKARSAIAGLLAEVLEATGPKPKASGALPSGYFGPKQMREFLNTADPSLGVEIVCSVVLSDDREVIGQEWSVHDFHPTGEVTVQPVGSFAEAVAWVCRERMRSDPAQIPVRIE